VPVFTVLGEDFSWRDLILIAGGLFLIGKATTEIHENLEGKERKSVPRLFPGGQLLSVVLQIMILDIVFSIDSILTAIGLSQILSVMIIAIVISMAIMLWASEPLSAFIDRHPTIKMLALAFLILIGTALVADGFDFHIPRAYLYAAVAFSLVVEGLNLSYRKRRNLKP
jgi:predicted tellurium resistance membrane protein TerC